MAGRSEAITIAGGARGGDPFDVSLLSQSLPCKPRSLARPPPTIKDDEPPPLELPQSSPAHDPITGDTERGRTLIRFTSEISAGELSSTPAERETYLSQSCPNWSTFQMPLREEKASPVAEEETAPGAMAVPGHVAAVEAAIEAEGVIGKSPTILETFQLYNGAASLDDGLDKISEDAPLELAPEDEQPEEEEEEQFSLDA